MLGLQLQVDQIGEPLVQKWNQYFASRQGNIVFCRIHGLLNRVCIRIVLFYALQNTPAVGLV